MPANHHKNPPPQKQHFLMLLQQKPVHKFKKTSRPESAEMYA
jgi:hypothetical protein